MVRPLVKFCVVALLTTAVTLWHLFASWFVYTNGALAGLVLLACLFAAAPFLAPHLD